MTCEALRPIEILLIEDNPADVRWAREEFKDAHVQHHTVVITDGESAINYLDQVPEPRPDLILLDLNLPKRSGLEVLEEIKQKRELYDIPVMILTTSPLERQALIAKYSLPPDSYMLKPLTWNRFVDAARSYPGLRELIRKCTEGR